uniref:Uncharacterized protein n=1 Tax=Leersia perrieri TaxID=77586 RepID=A0A0D9X1A9_9ORYZ
MTTRGRDHDSSFFSSKPPQHKGSSIKPARPWLWPRFLFASLALAQLASSAQLALPSLLFFGFDRWRQPPLPHRPRVRREHVELPAPSEGHATPGPSTWKTDHALPTPRP